MRNILFLAAAVPVATCQYVVSNFIYQPTQQLVVDYQGTVLNYTGQSLTIPQVQKSPSVGLHNPPNETYLFVMVDPTLYGDNGTINALHTIQTDLTGSDSQSHVANSSFYELTSTKAPIAPYIQPSASAGPPTHHYTQLLFRQPVNFTIPPEFEYYLPLDMKNITNRVAFPLPKFVQAAGLAGPVAGNYFSLSRSSSAATTSSGSVPSATPASSSSSAASPTASHSDAGKSLSSNVLLSVAGSACWMLLVTRWVL